ncbi:Retrovirus-related Pol polyprotein from transposon TNT 1-94 [Nymphaea thermarum]|nr:Retrovirus-related Pol polyprotein from transposon TNT 1-94 [Nymphaea thermarum]
MASFSSIATLVSVKLNRDNYLLWRSQLESVMISQDLMKFVGGSGEAPLETIMRNGSNELNPEFTTWRKTDQLVSSWIKATVSEAVLDQIIRTRSAREAWTTLEKLYGSPSPLRVMLLKKELMFIKKGNSDMVSYLQKIKMLVDSLDAAGCHTQNEDLVQIVLNGLPSKYESLVTSLVTSNAKMPSFTELYDILLNQETRLQLIKNDVAETPMEKQVSITAFNTIRGRGCGRGRGFYQGRGGRGRNQFHQTTGSQPNPHPPSAPQLPKKLVECQYCGRKGHTAKTCWDINPRAFSALTLQESGDEYWYPDTGATNNIVASDTHLENKQAYSGPESVMVGNGKFLPISHIGDLQVNIQRTDFLLKNSLHVPKIAHNLISVGRFTSDNNCNFEFTPSEFMIKDHKTGSVILRGRKTSDGLYLVQVKTSFNGDIKKACVARQIKKVQGSYEEWHRRLGHANRNIVSLLNSINLISINSPIPKKDKMK